MKVWRCEWFNGSEWSWQESYVLAESPAKARENVIAKGIFISDSPSAVRGDLRRDSFRCAEVMTAVFQIREIPYPSIFPEQDDQ